MKLSFFNTLALIATLAINAQAVQLQDSEESDMMLAQTLTEIPPGKGPSVTTKEASVLQPHEHHKHVHGKKGSAPQEAGRGQVHYYGKDEF